MKTITTLHLALALLASTAQGNTWEQLPSDMEGVYEQDLPVVLTAMRLKQPRTEVPGSITVITAKQIEEWGVRTIPELLRFVPGMVIGHSHYENNTTVSYHISNPNLMRRMQVLVDGRSVYKNAISAVIWDDIPVALEDIARIEVVRGPNSASYGANAFMSTVNIITKDPIETLSARVRYRSGNKGESDAFLSQAGLIGEGSYRISASMMQHDGFDNKYTRNDGNKKLWTDSKQHGFINGLYLRDFGNDIQFEIQGAVKDGISEVRASEFPELHSTSVFLQTKTTFQFSDKHQSHLQLYWNRERREQEGRAYAPRVFLSDELHQLYRDNPRVIKESIETIADALDAPENEGVSAPIVIGGIYPRLKEIDPSTNYISRLLNILQTTPQGLDNLYGDIDANIEENRFDFEWQDTVVWSDTVRSVTGINFRHDWVDSEHYFNGRNENNMYRLFGNLEWRMTPSLIWNAGASYEVEDKNSEAFSPRIALNWLLGEQQSLRFVVSNAVRSPDLLEQEADHGIVVRDIRDEDGVLILDKARFYEHRIATGNLDYEKITSYEIGYFGNFPRYGLQLDVKLYKDYLTNLISAPVNSGTLDIQSDVEIDVSGIDLQLQWQMTAADSLWFAWAYNDNTVDPGTYDDYEIRDSQEVIVQGERRASARNTYVTSWHHSGDQWGSSLSYFWYDQYNNSVTEYRRLELSVRKEFTLGRYTPWIGAWWQHIMGNEPYLSRHYHRYDTRNIYFFQAGLNF